MQNTKPKVKEDVWINTMCARCYAVCAMRVHRVNGVAIEIEGIPGSTQGADGGLCPKGLASLQVLYDPNRLNVPLRRMNPEKGIGVDPEWKEITWDEAFDEIVPRLKKIVEEDSRKLAIGPTMAYPGAPTGKSFVPLTTLGPVSSWGWGARSPLWRSGSWSGGLDSRFLVHRAGFQTMQLCHLFWSQQRTWLRSLGYGSRQDGRRR
ncbi:MAG: hypothetical protein QF369_02720 [Dehalococcoidales bacterium]|nr:hypothetical protein [Dehalococcoidales bacterium]